VEVEEITGELTPELVKQAIRASFEKLIAARGCRRAVYINEEPRYIEVVETQELVVIPDVEAELAIQIGPVDHIMWIPKHRAEMYVIVIDYVTEDGSTVMMVRSTIVIDRRVGTCWQYIEVGQMAVELAAKEILRLLEQ
jgi:hypothetical protein